MARLEHMHERPGRGPFGQRVRGARAVRSARPVTLSASARPRRRGNQAKPLACCRQHPATRQKRGTPLQAIGPATAPAPHHRPRLRARIWAARWYCLDGSRPADSGSPATDTKTLTAWAWRRCPMSRPACSLSSVSSADCPRYALRAYQAVTTANTARTAVAPAVIHVASRRDTGEAYGETPGLRAASRGWSTPTGSGEELCAAGRDTFTAAPGSYASTTGPRWPPCSPG
jgi:hypothetical protein